MKSGRGLRHSKTLARVIEGAGMGRLIKSVLSLGRRRVFVFFVGDEGRFMAVTRPAKLYSTTFGCPDCEGIRAGFVG